jgi:hypothetical protein
MATKQLTLDFGEWMPRRARRELEALGWAVASAATSRFGRTT